MTHSYHQGSSEIEIYDKGKVFKKNTVCFFNNKIRWHFGPVLKRERSESTASFWAFEYITRAFLVIKIIIYEKSKLLIFLEIFNCKENGVNVPTDYNLLVVPKN